MGGVKGACPGALRIFRRLPRISADAASILAALGYNPPAPKGCHLSWGRHPFLLANPGGVAQLVRASGS